MLKLMRWLAAFALGLSLGIAAPASAQDGAQARELFEQGVTLSDAGRWAEALSFFERSFELQDRPGTRFNVAMTLLRLGRVVDCKETLQIYLLRPDVQSDPARVEQARELLEVANRQITELTLYLTPGTTQLNVDGRAVPGDGAVRTISLDPGPHVLAISAPGHSTERRELDMAPGPQTLRVALEVADPGAPVRADPFVEELATPLQEESGGVFSSPVFWVVISVLVIGGATAGVLLATQTEAAPSGGDSGVILEALTWP